MSAPPSRLALILQLTLAISGARQSLASEPNVRFEDVTDAAGITFVHDHGGEGRRYLPETMGAGIAALDYDGDGWMDLYFVQSGALIEANRIATHRLYRGLGPDASGLPRFEDVTERARAGGAGYGQGAVAADFDGDGFPDLYLTNFGPNVLLRNRGDGTFGDATLSAGVGDPSWSTSAVAFDADGDGDLDLYVVNYLLFSLARHRDCRRGPDQVTAYCHPDAYPAAPDRFYRNIGNGTFVDATAAMGLEESSGKGLGALAADFDGDGWQELYVANDSTPNFLYRQEGGGAFEEVALFVGVGYNEEGQTEAGMGVDAGDVDGDGFLDLVVTNLSLETNALYLGSDGMFTYATRRAGLHTPSLRVLGFGVDLLDFDNDGDLDLAVANGDVLDNVESFGSGLTYRQASQIFENDGKGRFVLVPQAMAGPLATPRVGRGTTTLDADRDGRLDLAIAFNNDRARLFRNIGPAGHWLALGLDADSPNRFGIGATITVETEGRRQLDTIKAGSSYASSGVALAHFGLAQASKARRVTLRWPHGPRQVFIDLDADAIYRVRRALPEPSKHHRSSP